MGFLDRLRKSLGGGQQPVDHGHWVYVQCARCSEPLRTRIDLANDPSLADDGETYIVRKGLIGGTRRCYQTIEVIVHFNSDKSQVMDREISGGRFITAEEYQTLEQEQWQQPQEQDEDA